METMELYMEKQSNVQQFSLMENIMFIFKKYQVAFILLLLFYDVVSNFAFWD